MKLLFALAVFLLAASAECLPGRFRSRFIAGFVSSPAAAAGTLMSRKTVSWSRKPLTVFAGKPKEITLRDPCREYLLKGINVVADTVRVTLGPRGRNVLVEKPYGPPMIVNDGVTIARNIELKDRNLNAGAKLVQETASTSDDRAGDGTTSTCILTAEIAKKGVEFVNGGHNPIPIQKGIEKAARLMEDEVRKLAKPVNGLKDLKSIATVATSGNSVMGDLIAKAFDKLGNTAATLIEDSLTPHDELEFTEGYTFDRGYSTPYFLVGEDRDMVEFQAPAVLVCDSKLDNAQALVGILEGFVKSKRPLVIIADDFSSEVTQTLAINKMRGILKVVAVKAPSFGERRKDYLTDIAVATGGTLITKDVGLSLDDVRMDMLGTADRVVVRKERTSIVTTSENQATMNNRISKLQEEREKSTSKYDKEKFEERIAALSGGIARILVGAATETEQKEKKLRYEDAINAVRAAMETGYVPGGGVTYLALATPEFQKTVLNKIEEDLVAEAKTTEEGEEAMPDEEAMEGELELQMNGAKIILEAMKSVTKQIAENAGVNGEKVVNTIINAHKPFGFGWNARTGKFGDMMKMGVIDPAKVIISAIENAASVAGLVLTTEGLMVELPETDKKEPPPNPMGDYDE